MNSDTPKQFLPLCGKPILLRTIEAFYQYSPSLKIIIGLPEQYIEGWKELCRIHQHDINEKIIAGGESRFQTVKACLDEIPGTEGCVAIHDGVRPLVPKDVIANSFSEAKKGNSAIAHVPLKQSLRIMSSEGHSRAVDRSKYSLVQTPQTFPVIDIKRAYQQPEIHTMTDDATVAEQAGIQITLIPGSDRNIKITTPADLAIAEALFNKITD